MRAPFFYFFIGCGLPSGPIPITGCTALSRSPPSTGGSRLILVGGLGNAFTDSFADGVAEGFTGDGFTGEGRGGGGA